MSYSHLATGFDSSQARVGVTGAVRKGPLGSPIQPLDKNSRYPDTYINMGYLSPDGVEISFDEDKSEWIPWQELNAIREDITKSAKKVKITLWQFNKGNTEVYFGLAKGTVRKDEDTGVWSFYEDAIPRFERAQYCIDVVDGDAAMRLTLLEAQVSSRDAIVIKRDEMIGLTIELSTYPAGSAYEGFPSAGKTTHWQFTDTWFGATSSSSTDGSSALTVSTTALPAGTVNEPYAGQLAATGGDGEYTWEITSGTLPAGIELATNGALTGTPTAEGSAEITVKVTDSQSLAASKALTITISAA